LPGAGRRWAPAGRPGAARLRRRAGSRSTNRSTSRNTTSSTVCNKACNSAAGGSSSGGGYNRRPRGAKPRPASGKDGGGASGRFLYSVGMHGEGEAVHPRPWGSAKTPSHVFPRLAGDALGSGGRGSPEGPPRKAPWVRACHSLYEVCAFRPAGQPPTGPKPEEFYPESVKRCAGWREGGIAGVRASAVTCRLQGQQGEGGKTGGAASHLRVKPRCPQTGHGSQSGNTGGGSRRKERRRKSSPCNRLIDCIARRTHTRLSPGHPAR
jgi:hypothetical protein